MIIKFIEILNFRKLKSTHIDFDKQTTIFVGANNSGKTSAMVALRYFLVHPDQLALRDVTIANWTKIDALGSAWESEATELDNLNDLLPSLDVWLDVNLSKIHHVAHILPTLDWNGGKLGVRLKYHIEEMGKLKANYLLERKAAQQTSSQGVLGEAEKIQVWPTCLTEFLEKRLRTYIELKAFTLDPSALVEPKKGLAKPQKLPDNAFPLEKHPFKHLIKVHEIAAQRDFSDAGGRSSAEDDVHDTGARRYKRRLSDQLRSYYDRHLDPMKTPSSKDYKALCAIQTAEHSFDKRLKEGFAAAFKELEDLGYPGIADPKLKITTQLRATDGLRHGSAIQYQVADLNGDGSKTLQLPEDYSGLGYQNLIAMVFMLMGYRDEWMRKGKASTGTEQDVLEQIQPLHLVLVEEPEAHLHAQVQQVFIKKAYKLLRAHEELGDKTTFSTQLIVSTHSSHVAHEADFASLRYFRRRPAISSSETPTTTVANLSYIFGEEDETQRFVKRYLKATHCDLFFADGIIFVEGQAERILVPHFIRHHFESLSRRYITLLEIGGSHAHRFKNLVDELGLTTLIIADLDATQATKGKNKKGEEKTYWIAKKPQRKLGQKSCNPVLKEWHPLKELIDDLIDLKPLDHQSSNCIEYNLYVAYQKPLLMPEGGKEPVEVIPRTFEDALILENFDIWKSVTKSKTINTINKIIQKALPVEELTDELFQLIKSIKKAEFALDCLMFEDDKVLKPPSYIKEGLTWLAHILENDLVSESPEIDP